MKEKILFNLMMSGCMALMMSGVMTYLHSPSYENFFLNWMRGFATAYGIAFILAMVLAPMIRKLTMYFLTQI